MNLKTQKYTASILFLLSGLVSLVFQVVWLKMLVLVFGNTIWAVTTLLVAFMSGLALGSWVFGKIADRVPSPLKLYGIIEAIIGFLGLLTPLIFTNLDIIYRPLYRILGGDSLLMGFAKFLIAFLILLIPTSLMGATLPLLAKKFTPKIKEAGSNIGFLYTINTFGAVIGTLLAGFLLIPLFGIKMTVLVASLVNFIILIVILILTAGESIAFSKTGLFKFQLKKSENNFILWIFLLCGFAALSYEVLWNRILVLHIGSSVYAYAVMLGVFLLGISLGSGLMSYFVKIIKNPLYTLGFLQLMLVLSILLQIKQFSKFSITISNFGSVIGYDSYWKYVGSLFLSTFRILIIPTLIFGATFPLVVKFFVQKSKEVGKDTGLLYAFNTVGTIFGSFLTGFIFIPLLGAQKSLLLIGTLSFVIGAYLLLKFTKNLKLSLSLVAMVLVIFISLYALTINTDEVLLKAGIFNNSEQDTVEILDFSEDIYATVTVEERTDVRGTWKSLSMNGVNVAGTSCELFTIQKLQGHLPMLLHKNPKSVLHIGFGSGGTAHAVSCYPVDKITIAEISKSIIKKSSEFFKEINYGVLDDPRIEINFTDGRNFVLASNQKFDVILSDSIHPRFSGNGSLYTYDYYKLLRERLKPGGLVSQWLPYYSLTTENFKMIIKAFHKVFPNTSVWYTNSTFNSYVIVIGKTDGPEIDFGNMAEKFKIEKVLKDMDEIDTANPFKVLDYFMFANDTVTEFVGDVPLHTDDNMAVEYMSGKIVNRFQTTLNNFASILKFREDLLPYLVNIESDNMNKGLIIDEINKYHEATGYNLSRAASILFEQAI